MKRSVQSVLVAAGFASMVALGGGVAHATDGAANLAQTHDDGGFGGCRMEKGHKRGHFLKQLAKKLNLSEQQVAQVKASFKNRAATVRPMMATLRAERSQLRELVHSGNADEAAIRAQSAKVAAIESDLAVQRAQGAKELRSILTPEQQAKFKALRSEWQEKMKKRHQHHGGPEEF